MVTLQNCIEDKYQRNVILSEILSNQSCNNDVLRIFELSSLSKTSKN